MSQQSAPSAPLPVTTLGLARGQSYWLCLAPGSALRTTRGEVAVRFAPGTCGPAVHSLPPTVLKAGACLPWAGQTQAAWIQVDNNLDSPAEIQWMEGVTAPGAGQTVWQWLRSAWAARRMGRTDLACGTAHATR